MGTHADLQDMSTAQHPTIDPGSTIFVARENKPTYLHDRVSFHFQTTEDNIILFIAITMLCRIDNIMQNIPHFQTKFEEYFIILIVLYKIFLTLI